MLSPILSSNPPSLVIPLPNTNSGIDLNTKPLMTKILTTKPSKISTTKSAEIRSSDIREQEQNRTSNNTKNVISSCALKFITVRCQSKNMCQQQVSPTSLIQSQLLKKLPFLSHKITPSLLIENKISNEPLKPCQKQHMSTTSQSLEYRSSLPDQSRVSFSTTAPITRQQPHLFKAYQEQNTIIDSHCVAKEVHQQHCI